MVSAERKPATVRGTVLLRDHLVRNPSTSLEAFARRCDVALRSVQRWVNDAVVPRSPAHRKAITRASKGDVPGPSWDEPVVETLVESLTKKLEGGKS